MAFLSSKGTNYHNLFTLFKKKISVEISITYRYICMHIGTYPVIYVVL